MAVREMERKVTKIGNSLGVTFPADVLKKINVKQGDEVNVEVRNGEIVLTKSTKVSLPKGISPDFFDVLDQTMVEYDQTLKGLKDR